MAYGRAYLTPYKVADTAFYTRGEDLRCRRLLYNVYDYATVSRTYSLKLKP